MSADSKVVLDWTLYSQWSTRPVVESLRAVKSGTCQFTFGRVLNGSLVAAESIDLAFGVMDRPLALSSLNVLDGPAVACFCASTTSRKS